MKDSRELSIAELRPNNWFLCQEKVDQIRQVWYERRAETLPALLVTQIDGEWSLIDGHSRAFVAFENGCSHLMAEIRPLHEIEGHSSLYEFIHRAGPEQGISSMWDLRGRILSMQDYQLQWIGFCQAKLKSLR